ncbi:histidyl-tRNA synthetase [Nocardia sp. GAS34]
MRYVTKIGWTGRGIWLDLPRRGRGDWTIVTKTSTFNAPKGIPDYVPPGSAEFVAVRDALVRSARLAGYGHIELPVFEDTMLFARGVGESTDVVSKEMYTFADRGDRSVTLRPEGTAGVMRAVIEHGLDRGQLPVKLCYAGPFFRYERPQAGRYRQLQQVGIEAIGVDDPALDAEVIAVADAGFRSLGLDGFRLEITSLGDDTCRPQYRELLQKFLFGLPLDEETRRRAELNPLRVLDDKRPEVRELTAAAPLMLDHLSDSAKVHFEQVLGYLDALGVPYTINPRMVRGLDYYTKTTFEFVHDGLGAQSGIGGGGRYDGLMAQLGGQPLSGIGFGLGVDRTVLALQAEGKTAADPARVDVFGVPLGDAATQRLVVLAAKLRAAGIRVDIAYGGRGVKGAMKAADRSGAKYALVLGDRDLSAGEIGLKDLASGEQRQIAIDAVAAEVAAALAQGR